VVPSKAALAPPISPLPPSTSDRYLDAKSAIIVS